MSQPTNEPLGDEELALDRYFLSVWRAKWLIVLITIAAAGVAWFIARRQPALHTATALIEIGRVWKEPIEDPYLTKEIVNGATFTREVADKIGEKVHRLKRSVRADVAEGGAKRERYPLFLRLTATTESADESVKLAQAVADAVVARHEKLFENAIAPHLETQKRLEARLRDSSSQSSANREFVVSVERELDEIKANNSVATISKKSALLEPPSLTGTVPPEVWRRVAAAGLIAAFISIISAVLIGRARSLSPGR